MAWFVAALNIYIYIYFLNSWTKYPNGTTRAQQSRALKQGVAGHAWMCLVHRQAFCFTNVAYASDNFTPDDALETSFVQGKTPMAVQSLTMTELQIGELGKAGWKWQQKGAHLRQVSDRERRWQNLMMKRWWQYKSKNQQSNNVLLFNALPMTSNIRYCKWNHEASCIMFPNTTLQGKRKDGLSLAVSFLNFSINLTCFKIFSASVHML